MIAVPMMLVHDDGYRVILKDYILVDTVMLLAARTEQAAYWQWTCPDPAGDNEAVRCKVNLTDLQDGNLSELKKLAEIEETIVTLQALGLLPYIYGSELCLRRH